MMAELSHILVVDDDTRIRSLLQSYLMEHGFRVTTAASAGDARARLAGLEFDLLVLDIMMPGETGIDLVSSMRADGVAVPVLLLSALSDPTHRIAGLSSGGDDYLAKPFEPEELLLRIRGLLRRSLPMAVSSKHVRFGEWLFAIVPAELRKGENTVRLTSREKDILRLLAQRPGEVLSRVQLAQNANDDSARSVDVQINRLRQKIETDPADPKYLQTVRGSGYALFADVV